MTHMIVVPAESIFFDDEAILAMGVAFDRVCASLRYFPRAAGARELIAKRIIAAAKNGERDVVLLHWHALTGFPIQETPIPVARDLSG